MVIRISRKNNTRWLYAGLAFGWMLSFAGVTPLRADPFWGATADGSARQFEITCSTCPNPVTTLSDQSNGGFGSVTAGVEFGSGTEVGYSAVSVLNGPNALPTLHASANANIVAIIGPPPDTFFFDATAIARGTQLYTYSGTSATDYTLEYNVNGSMFGGPLTEISGGFTVVGSGFNPGQEVQPTLGFTFDHVNGDGTEKPVHLTGDVTFTVNPGDEFFVQSTLIAIVDSRSAQLPASADAAHTLAMQFTQGDTSLLTPAAIAPSTSDVPEPITSALLGIGLVGVGLTTRRKWRRP